MSSGESSPKKSKMCVVNAYYLYEMKSPGREFQEAQSVSCRLGAFSVGRRKSGIRGFALPVLPAWLGEFQNPVGKWVGLSGNSTLRKGQEGTKGNPWDQGWICWRRKEGRHKLCIHICSDQITFSPLLMPGCRKQVWEGM